MITSFGRRAIVLAVWISAGVVWAGVGATSLAPVQSGEQENLRLEALLTLRGTASAQPSRWSQVAQTADGWIVAPLLEGGAAYFSVSGVPRWVRDSTVSSDNWNNSVTTRGDSVVLFDAGRGKAVILQTSNGKVVREFSIPAGSSYVMNAAGQVITTANDRSPGRIGYPVHRIDPQGNLISFGGMAGEIVGTSDPWRFEWKIARGVVAPTFWTHTRDRFFLEEWRDTARTGRNIHADPAWLLADGPNSGAPAGPIALFHTAHVAADGLIWTIGHALDPAWRVTLGANARQLPPLEAETKVHDTMLEVWNPITKQRAKGVRINAVLMGFAGDAVVFSPRVEGERVVMDLWRVRQ